MKRKMKKAASLVLSLVMVMGMAGCSMEKEAKEPEKETATKADGEKRIAFISPANQFDFFVYIGAEIKKIGEEKGVQVDMFDAALDVNKEADLMSQAVLQEYDAIIVGPVDTEALVPSIKEANDAGIPVINYDSFVEGAEVYARVGSGNNESKKCWIYRRDERISGCCDQRGDSRRMYGGRWTEIDRQSADRESRRKS